MRRSEKNFPLGESEVYETLRKMWKSGWLDEYSEKHFLIRLLNGDDLVRRMFNHNKCTFDGVIGYFFDKL